MPEDHWEDGAGGIFVDFSGDKRASNKMRERAQRTEYNDRDLASGYHKSEIWTTKDGRKIAIPNLADSHLLNIIAFLRRRTEDYRKMAIAQVAVGIAETSLILNIFTDVDFKMEHAYQHHLARLKKEGHRIFQLDGESLLREFFPIYQKLYQEAYKRKLLIEVDKTKLPDKALGHIETSQEDQNARDTTSKKVKEPTWAEQIELMAKATRETDGMEVYKDDWKLAEAVVKKYPEEFRLGSSRGPDRAWKRLHYIEDSVNG